MQSSSSAALGGLIFGSADRPVRMLRALGARARRAVLQVAAGVGLTVVLALGANAIFATRAPFVPKPAPKPRNTWSEVVGPMQFYSLASADFGKQPRAYQARRNVGGGRQDVLSYGPAQLGKGLALRLSIYRFGQETPSDGRFFVEIARLAGQAGYSVARSAQPGEMTTRFGAFEVADVALKGGAGQAACLGFETEAASPGLRISGYACGTVERPVDRRILGCALDRLDLVSAGDDQDLARYFVAAELARGKACGGMRPAPEGRTAWLGYPS